MQAQLTLIGGPTLLLEIAGLRLLTDPTFDPPGDNTTGAVTLTKTTGPALPMDAVGQIDAVLLSHDQHADNLDNAGRALLTRVPCILTTPDGAQRLGAPAQGLAPWATVDLPTPKGDILRVTTTPARHGPAGIEPIVGAVTGFVLTLAHAPDHAIYLTGDTVWFAGVAEVAQRFHVTLVVPFAGAAQTRGPFHLTMDTNDAIETASAFPDALVAPAHCEGWAHFKQNQDDLRRAFAAVGLADRLRLLTPGVATMLPW